MFLRLTRTSVPSAKYQEAMRFSDQVIAAARRLPGFQAGYIAGDASAGRGVIVTVWDTREHAQFDRGAEALRDVVGQSQALGVQMEAPEIYEIAAQS